MGRGTASISFVPQGFEEIEAKYGEKEHVRIVMRQALRDIGKLLVPKLKENTPRGATRKLRNKTFADHTGLTSDDMRVEIIQPAYSEKGFPYGIAVRTGTRPHFPPSSALVPWVKSVLNVPDAKAAGVAFCIARKISRVGTKENIYHIRTYEENKTEIYNIVQNNMDELVQRLDK